MLHTLVRDRRCLTDLPSNLRIYQHLRPNLQHLTYSSIKFANIPAIYVKLIKAVDSREFVEVKQIKQRICVRKARSCPCKASKESIIPSKASKGFVKDLDAASKRVNFSVCLQLRSKVSKASSNAAVKIGK